MEEIQIPDRIRELVDKINRLASGFNYVIPIGDKEAEEEVARREEETIEKIVKLVKAYGLELEGGLDYGFCNQYFNAPCTPVEYRYYSCDVCINIVDWEDKVMYVLCTISSEGTRCGEKFRSIGKFEVVDVVPLIDREKTPFTFRLVEKLSQVPIRPIWKWNIDSYVREILNAELEGRLTSEFIRDVLNRVSMGVWVYEYGYLYGAIESTAKEFGLID